MLEPSANCYCLGKFNPFPYKKFVVLPNSKEFADDNLSFDENGGKFSKRVENAVGIKGEIACAEHFLVFPQCFQKTCIADMEKQGFVWERVNIVRFGKELI